ncbi:Formyltransferase [Rhodofomes roseus]|uniref:Methionyl-tRNA formyltransferase, mitochondrial n=1 Tax=Rhodofomes roseus TaxID=34475 RepID=A0ABQ8K7S6_9APHY|nr:Formyltransferase [Rhodofomes roseus]KAH9833243.1 Formyltransferase [Rhodofomes roseus]
MLNLRAAHISSALPRPSAACYSVSKCSNNRNRSRRVSVPWNGVGARTYSQAPAHDPFKILYLGRDEFSCSVLEELLKAKDVWQELAIVTTPDTRVGRRGEKLAVSPLKVFGQQLDLPVHFIPSGKGKDVLKTWQLPPPWSLQGATPSPSHIIVTASFGRILPNSVLDLFLPNRRLNVHPSLLPAYRGAAPIQHVILDGQKETGVCIVEMMERAKGLDAGAIWGQEQVAVPKDATYANLRDTLAPVGGRLLVSVLRDMLSGKATSKPQAEDPTTPRAPLINLEDAVIDFESMTAEQIARRSRAISHQRPVVTSLKNRRTLQLHSVTAVTDAADVLEEQLTTVGTAIYHRPTDSLLVRCASDTVLSVQKVKQQDRNLLAAREWWNGVRPGLRQVEGDTGPVLFLRPPVGPS